MKTWSTGVRQRPPGREAHVVERGADARPPRRSRAGSGTVPVIGSASSGLVPQVTTGAISAASSTTSRSKPRRRRCEPAQSATARSQSAPLGAKGGPSDRRRSSRRARPCRSARRPRSTGCRASAALHRQPSHGLARIFDAWPRAPSAPSRAIQFSAMSLAPTPGPSARRPDAHGARLLLPDRLRGQHMRHLGRADAEGHRAEARRGSRCGCRRRRSAAPAASAPVPARSHARSPAADRRARRADAMRAAVPGQRLHHARDLGSAMPPPRPRRRVMVGHAEGQFGMRHGQPRSASLRKAWCEPSCTKCRSTQSSEARPRAGGPRARPELVEEGARPSPPAPGPITGSQCRAPSAPTRFSSSPAGRGPGGRAPRGARPRAPASSRTTRVSAISAAPTGTPSASATSGAASVAETDCVACTTTPPRAPAGEQRRGGEIGLGIVARDILGHMRGEMREGRLPDQPHAHRGLHPARRQSPSPAPPAAAAGRRRRPEAAPSSRAPSARSAASASSCRRRWRPRRAGRSRPTPRPRAFRSARRPPASRARGAPSRARRRASRPASARPAAPCRAAGARRDLSLQQEIDAPRLAAFGQKSCVELAQSHPEIRLSIFRNLSYKPDRLWAGGRDAGHRGTSDRRLRTEAKTPPRPCPDRRGPAGPARRARRDHRDDPRDEARRLHARRGAQDARPRPARPRADGEGLPFGDGGARPRPRPRLPRGASS
jgi:hypothetical protein